MPSVIGLDTLTTISRQTILPDIVDGVYDSHVLLYRLVRSNKKMIQGGNHIEYPIQYARPNIAGPYQGYDVINVAPFDVLRAAAWDWKQYQSHVTIDGLSTIKANSPDAVADLISTQFDIARAELEMALGADLYRGVTGSGNPKALDGLADAVANSGTYGTLNHANSYWQAKVNTGTTQMSVGALFTMFGDLTIGREHPTIILSRQAQYNRFASLVYGTSGASYDLQVPAVGSDEVLGQAGFTNLLFNNVPWVVDSLVDGSSDGKVYFLNENHMRLIVSSRADMFLEDFVRPHNQDAATSLLLWAGNFIVSNPRLQGVFTSFNSI